MTNVQRLLPLILALFFTVIASGKSVKQPSINADVIIYGGTSAAISAAVQVKRMGKTVVIVSPDKHLGGLTSSGLGFTDTGNKEVINGIAREFYQQVYQHYQNDSSWKWQDKSQYGNTGQGTPAIDGNNRTMWIFEPHVAEQIFEKWIAELNVKVFRNEWLDRANGVVKKNGRITSITTLSGQTYKGKMFIDATYEGDLMAAAGVPYHVGREANSTYNEKWNGVEVGILHHKHHFKTNISPYFVAGDSTSGVLPLISTAYPGKKGEADKRIQAYCFRMCLSKNPKNQIPFPKPENYDAKMYQLLARVYASGWDETFEKFDPIPNLKTDNNNHGPVSTDYIGMNYTYPDASYKARKAIIADHKSYQQGLMYYLSNDEHVPLKIRQQMQQWGLAKDEFIDNNNWPYQIYVREARRMSGDYIMTEHEVMGNRQVPEPIAMGSYTLDAHNAQRYIKPDGYVQNEGDISVEPPAPYQIAYHAILPKKQDCENLLVPVCVSSSHIAFGSMRMEPVFMILGQGAATAAVQAISKNKALQDLDYNTLKKQLVKDHVVLQYKL
jgi:hypothetical protein